MKLQLRQDATENKVEYREHVIAHEWTCSVVVSSLICCYGYNAVVITKSFTDVP